MKISLKDWFYAVCYSPLYAEDYKEYQNNRSQDFDEILLDEGIYRQSRLSTPANKLCEKWGIDFPVDPIKKGDAFPKEDDFLSFFINPVKPLPAPRKWRGYHIYRLHNEDTEVIYVNGRIVISIDPRFPLDIIIKELEKYLKPEVAKIKFEQPSTKTKTDHWYIYHKHIVEEKSIADIAVELFNVSRSPGIDTDTGNAQKNVSRLIKKQDSSAKSVGILRFREMPKCMI